ncbi:hypothetical protein MMC07_002712 [Pseudocyphellaria aurata]|nr:hypothetical protein [Pseudocyphellaria aurata]
MLPIPYPYLEGNTLLLETDKETTFPLSFDGFIRCRIVKLYRPSTLSCVMEVETETEVYERRRFVLKLYDRRYATQLRKDHKAEPWDIAQESAYFDFVKDGDASKFLEYIREEDEIDEPEGNEPHENELAENNPERSEPEETYWNDQQIEVYLLNVCLDLFERECTAYDRMKDLQGQDIPQLVAKVRIPPARSSFEGLGVEFFQVKGILLELIDGFTLGELIDHAPREDWQAIFDQAIRVVRICDDREILNEDVRPPNVMVAPLPSKPHAYRVVMLDFTQCSFRAVDDSDRRWGRHKWLQDEEGDLGRAMQSRLKRVGFALVYEPSRRYQEWARVEGDDD